MNIIFTRHKLTKQQLMEIGQVHLDLSYLAKTTIKSKEESQAIYTKIIRQAVTKANQKIYHIGLFGVIPPILRWIMVKDSSTYIRQEETYPLLITYETFNKEWIITGIYKPRTLVIWNKLEFGG